MSSRKDVAYEDNGMRRKLEKAHYINLFAGDSVLKFLECLCKTFPTSTALYTKKELILGRF